MAHRARLAPVLAAELPTTCSATPSIPPRTAQRSGGSHKADPGALLFAPNNKQDPVLHVRIYPHIAHERAVAELFVRALGAIAPNPRKVTTRAAS